MMNKTLTKRRQEEEEDINKQTPGEDKDDDAPEA